MRRVRAVVRGLWPDHNPLRRASDRAEAGIVAGLAMAFLLGAPLIALAVWHLGVSTAFTVRAAERAGWRPVPATLLTDAPGSYGYAVTTPARWRGPGSPVRTGRVTVPPGARAGTTVTVWAGHSGQLTRTPLSSAQAGFQAGVTAALAVPCWGMLLLCAGAASRRLLDIRRLAGWDAGWRAMDRHGPAGASPGP